MAQNLANREKISYICRRFGEEHNVVQNREKHKQQEILQDLGT